MIRRRHRVHKLRRRDANAVGKGCYYLDEITLLNSYGIRLGDRVGFATGCWLNGFGGIAIGHDTIIGPGCYIHSANHRVQDGRVVRNKWDARPVYIGAHVWIGAGCIILPGAYITGYTIVGAGSVVAGRAHGRIHGPKAS